MGNSIGLSETLIIAFGAMVVVLAGLTLYSISIITKLLNNDKNEKTDYMMQQSPTQGINNNGYVENNVQSFSDDDEEDRLVVALAASALAASDKPDSHFHITKITRIK